MNLHENKYQAGLYISYILTSLKQIFTYIFLRFYLFIFRERGREGGREGEKHHCVAASPTASTGDLACNPGMCPDWESSPEPSGSQACAQSTEPYQLENHLHSTVH